MWRIRIIIALVVVLTSLGISILPAKPAFAAGTWTTKTSMPAARVYAAAAVINDVLYVAGGHDGVTGGTTTLQAYNPTTNTWSTLAPMPGRRYLGDGAGVINGELYVAGGWNYPDSGIPTSSLFIYNPGTNSWRSAASMPTLSGEGATGVINDKLYVTTATNGYSGWRDFLHVYDPGTNSWSSLASSPNVHDAPAFGVINNKFYVAGGGDTNGTPHAKLDVYDPATNTWATKAPMPTAGRVLASGVFNAKLYAIGGYVSGPYLNSVYVYDPATDTWTTETSMPTARAGAVAGVINGVLYVAGGSNSTGTLGTVEAFTLGTWTSKTSMPAGRALAAAAVINDVLYVAGGHDGVTGGTPTLQAYNPATDSWSTLASMPGRRDTGDGAGVIDGKLYVPGGWNYPDSGLPQSTLFVYNPGTNSWSSKASMPTLSGHGASGVINGKLYVLTAANGYSGWWKLLHVYDPGTDAWSQLASPPSTHVLPAFGVIDNKFYVAGGGESSGTLDVYDPVTNTWATKAPMPVSGTAFASAVLNGKLYAIGGSIAGVTSSTVYVYDPATDTWTTETSMPTARYGAAAGVISGVLYVAGFSVSTGTLGTVEAFTTTPGATYTITASAGANGTISPSGAVTVNSGANQTFTITPNTGYHVADVLVDGSSVGAVSSYTFTTVTANHTIAASFAINTFTLTASAGANGSITPAGAVEVNSGANQSFTITPSTGYHIANVLVDGGSVSAVSSYTFTTVTANHTITASFTITNQPPFALFGYSPETPQVKQKVTFNASASYDPDGTIVSYQWNFGDEGTASGQIVEHTYSAAGDYTVTLTVQDNNGAANAKAKAITVTPLPTTSGRRSLPDPSTWAMVGSGLAAGLCYIALSRLRQRLSRS